MKAPLPPGWAYNVSGSGNVAPVSPDALARQRAQQAALHAEEQRKNRNHQRLLSFGRMAAIGIPTAGLALGASGPMAAASGGGWSMPGVSAPVFGGGAATTGAATGGAVTAGKVTLGSRLGSIFNSAGMNLGVNAGMALLGQRSNNKAAEQARLDTLKANAEALALQRQQLELEARNADLDREDARALNAAINELKKRELDALEEQRAFDRGLIEQREARAEPYRRRGVQALDRLAAMWSLGG